MQEDLKVFEVMRILGRRAENSSFPPVLSRWSGLMGGSDGNQ